MHIITPQESLLRTHVILVELSPNGNKDPSLNHDISRVLVVTHEEFEEGIAAAGDEVRESLEKTAGGVSMAAALKSLSLEEPQYEGAQGSRQQSGIAIFASDEGLVFTKNFGVRDFTGQEMDKEKLDGDRWKTVPALGR